MKRRERRKKRKGRSGQTKRGWRRRGTRGVRKGMGREKEGGKENNLGKGCIVSRYIGYGESCKMEML